jgi:hypothetical protein
LAESKNHFKIRNGDIEIEYEGPLPEVNKRFDQAYLWATSPKTKPLKNKDKEIDEGQGEKKKDNRGGPRKTIYTGKIEELIEEGFFAKRKSLDEVMKALFLKNVPTKGAKAKNAILASLRRRIANKDSKLKGSQEEDIWYFWID